MKQNDKTDSLLQICLSATVIFCFLAALLWIVAIFNVILN